MGSLTSCIAKMGKALDADDAKEIRLRARQLVNDDKVDPAKAALESIQTQIDLATQDLRTIYDAAGLPFEVTEEVEEVAPAPTLESRRAAQPKDQERAIGGRVRDEETGEMGTVEGTPPVKKVEQDDSGRRLSPNAFDTLDAYSKLKGKVPKFLQDQLPPGLIALIEESEGASTVAAVKAANSVEAIAQAINSHPKGKRMEVQRALESVDNAASAINNALEDNTVMRFVVDRLLSRSDEDAARSEVTKPAEVKALQEYDNLVQKRKDALENLKKLSPLTYSSYVEANNRTRILTTEMISQIINSGKPLTKKDVAQIKKMRRQINTYATRQYRATSGDYATAKSYQDAVIQAYEKYLKDKVETPLAMRMVNAIEYLKRSTLDIGDFIEQATEQKGDRIMTLDEFQDLSRRWLPPSINEVPVVNMTDEQKQSYFDNTIKALLQVKEDMQKNGTYDKVLNAKAEQLAKEILGVVDTSPSGVAGIVRSIANNSSVLKQKRNISPEIRSLLGEITEPLMKLQMTQAMQAQALSKMILQSRLFDYLTDKGLLVSEDQMGTDAVKGQEFVPLKGAESFGKLAGYRTTPQIKAMLEGAQEVFVPGNQQALDMMLDPSKRSQLMGKPGMLFLLQKWQSAMILGQKMKVVWNPLVTVPTNFLGAAFQVAFQNGTVFNPNVVSQLDSMRKAILAASGTLAPEKRAKFNQFAEEVTRTKLQDSANVFDIQKEIRSRKAREMLRDITRENETKMEGLARASGQNIRDVYRAVDETLVWASATSDRAFVYYAYFMEKDYLKKFYKALGTPKSEIDLESEAAERIKLTNINPGRAPAFIGGLQKFGLASYSRFFYETYRSAGASAMFGAAEVMSGVKLYNSGKKEAGSLAIKRGSARLTGSLVALAASRVAIQAVLKGGGIAGLAYGLSHLLMGGGELEDEETKEENGFALLQPLSDRDKSFAFLGKDEEGRPYFADAGRFDALETSAGPLFSTLLQGDPVKAYEQIRGILFPNPLLSAVAGSLTGQKNFEETVTALAKGVTPRSILNLVTPTVTEETAPTAAKAANAAGLFVNSVEPNNIFKYAWFKQVADPITESRNTFTDGLDSMEAFDKDKFIKMVSDVKVTEAKLWDRASQMIKGARMMGFTDENIVASLDANNVDKDVRNALINGEYDSMILTPQYLRDRLRTKVRTMTEQDAEKLTGIYEQAIDELLNFTTETN